MIPEPKLPHLALPNIRNVPAIPHVGSAGASATVMVGEQFGNLPDLHAAVHLKTLKKALLEQVYALIQGELPQLARAPVYAARAAQLTNELAELATLFDGVVAAVTAEANAAIGFVNGKIADITAAKTAVEAIPAGARNAVHQLAIARYAQYMGELNAHKGRLQTVVGSIGS